MFNRILELYELALQFQNLAYLAIPLVLALKNKFQAHAKRPLSVQALAVMMILGVSGICLLGVYDDPPNVFTATGSRLQTSGSVLASRLGVESIPRFESQRGRSMYAVHGPALLECEWCEVNNPWSFHMYNLPRLLFPYAVSAFGTLGATSFGRNTAQWRKTAILSVVAVLCYDIYTLGTYPTSKNEAVRSPMDVEWVYWKQSRQRVGMLLIVHAITVGLVFMSATGRLYDIGDQATGDAGAEVGLKLQAARLRLRTVNMITDAALLDEKSAKHYADFYDQFRQNQQQQLEGQRAREEYQDAVLEVQATRIEREIGQLFDSF